MGHKRIEIDAVISQLSDSKCLLTIYDPETKMQFSFPIKKARRTLVKSCLIFIKNAIFHRLLYLMSS